LTNSVLNDLQPQEDIDKDGASSIDSDKEELMEQNRVEYERVILERQHLGEAINVQELKTEACLDKVEKGYVVNLDGVIQDIIELEHVNNVKYFREHVDW
jgi:anion-transporting  ArsA/GET3 family ATPase